MKHCKFITEEITQFNHIIRGLEITAEDGFIFSIYVTKEPAFSIKGKLNTWHYELSNNETKISLTGTGSHSVKFEPYFHKTITSWDLIK